MSDLSTRLNTLIGQYGLQCSETKELAPTTELADTLGEVTELERQFAEARSEKHKSIIKLANDMQYKMDKNSDKNTGWCTDGVRREEQGWFPPDCSLEFLIRKYYEEVGEFMEVLTMACLDVDVDPLDVRYEAADVANLVMMLRDHVLVMIGERR